MLKVPAWRPKISWFPLHTYWQGCAVLIRNTSTILDFLLYEVHVGEAVCVCKKETHLKK